MAREPAILAFALCRQRVLPKKFGRTWPWTPKQLRSRQNSRDPGRLKGFPLKPRRAVNI